MAEAGLFIFALVDTASLLFLTVFFVINLSDLECDYINAVTCCSRLNKFVIPEIAIGLILEVLLLYYQHWIYFLLNIPLSAWLIYRYVKKPSGNVGLYDPAEIHNRNELQRFLKECMIKLGFHLVFFFFYLYSMIAALLVYPKEKVSSQGLQE